jgi:hypothetical protein
MTMKRQPNAANISRTLSEAGCPRAKDSHDQLGYMVTYIYELDDNGHQIKRNVRVTSVLDRNAIQRQSVVALYARLLEAAGYNVHRVVGPKTGHLQSLEIIHWKD